MCSCVEVSKFKIFHLHASFFARENKKEKMHADFIPWDEQKWKINGHRYSITDINMKINQPRLYLRHKKALPNLQAEYLQAAMMDWLTLLSQKKICVQCGHSCWR